MALPVIHAAAASVAAPVIENVEVAIPLVGAQTMRLERYEDQITRWPRTGRHVLAHHDDETIVVYQAYRPSIGRWAVEHGKLGGPDFSFSRMSWIKPNFLWMMYRSGWGTKEGQEVVLGLRIQRSFFDSLLRAAVASSFGASGHTTSEEWQASLRRSPVRLQWDPDHDPSGRPVERRAIQLGLRADALVELAGPALVEVIDMSPMIAIQREHLRSDRRDLLELPREDVYVPPSDAASAVGLDAPPAVG